MMLLPNEFSKDRIFGLDLLRFFAIMMVVVGHSCLVMPDPLADKIYRFVLDGVAIFFVLSGFLIGGILVRQLEKGLKSWGDLLHFWKRRWMRTLPAYLLVLTFVLVYTAIAVPDLLPDAWWKYYLFIQNFFTPRPDFFSESWSLSVEEWFYLLIPLLIFGGILFFKLRTKTTVLLVILLTIAGIIAYRYYLYTSLFHLPEIDNLKALKSAGDDAITYQVVPRLDALMFGVLGAFVMHYYPRTWDSPVKYLLCCAGIVILFAIKRDNAGFYTLYDGVWSHSAKSAAVLLTLPFFSTWRIHPNWLTKSVTFISLISYSMYLLNWKVVMHIIIKNGLHHNTGRWVQQADWWWDYALFWCLTIPLSYLLYRCVEVPFMKLRKTH